MNQTNQMAGSKLEQGSVTTEVRLTADSGMASPDKFDQISTSRDVRLCSGDNAPTRQPSTFSIALWVYRFQLRYQRLYGAFLELRSCFHRIRLLCKRGSIAAARTGPAWVACRDQILRVNTRSQDRILDIQSLQEQCPWVSPEDLVLFLSGWDAGWECALRNHDRSDPN
jgi:hypothetical protein